MEQARQLWIRPVELDPRTWVRLRRHG
jgi:hypothetical protein